MSHDKKEVEIPNYHGHPNYFAIFLILIAMMILTIVLGLWESNPIVLVLIFAIAVFKAYLVMFKFMHLQWESKWLWTWMLWSLLCLGFFIGGTYIDVTNPNVQTWEHPLGWDAPEGAKKH